MSLDTKIKEIKVKPFKGLKLSEYKDPRSEEYYILLCNAIAHNWFLFYDEWPKKDNEFGEFEHAG